MTQKRKLSRFHLAQRKKISKRECPGCKQLFSSSYFEFHKSKRFDDGIWKCSTSDKERCTAEDAYVGEENSDSSSDFIETHKVDNIFTKFLRKKYANKEEKDAESDCDMETWENITMADLDEDLNINSHGAAPSSTVDPNVSIGGLLAWLCIFICMWQGVYMIPDTYINSLLSFLSTFFSVLEPESLAVSSMAAAFPLFNLSFVEEARTEKG